MSVAAGCECHVLLVFVWGLPLPWRTACRCCGSCWGCHWVYAAVWWQGQPGSSAEMGRLLFHSWLLCSSKSINSNSAGNHSLFHQPQLLNPFLQPHLQTALDTLWGGGDGGECFAYSCLSCSLVCGHSLPRLSVVCRIPKYQEVLSDTWETFLPKYLHWVAENKKTSKELVELRA